MARVTRVNGLAEEVRRLTEAERRREERNRRRRQQNRARVRRARPVAYSREVAPEFQQMLSRVGTRSGERQELSKKLLELAWLGH